MTCPEGWNKFCNAAQLRHWLAPISIVQQLYSANNDLDPLKEVTDEEAHYSLYYLLARGECWYRSLESIETNALVLASANVLLPYLNEKQSDKNFANSRIRLYTLALACHEITYGQYFDVTEEAYHAWGSRPPSLPVSILGYTPETLAEMVKKDNISSEDAVALLMFIRSRGKPSLSAEAMRMACAVLIALSRRGFISREKCETINKAFREDGLPDLKLDPDLVTALFRTLGSYIEGDNAKVSFSYLNTLFARCSLKIRLTVQQVSVRASLIAIRDALNKFPNFPWSNIADLLPDDCKAYLAAAEKVNTNSIYCMNSRLGCASPNLYKSLAYVGVKLLIKYGGPTFAGLSGYGGRTRNPLFKDRLDEYINNYDPNVELKGYYDEVPDGHVQRLKAALVKINKL